MVFWRQGNPKKIDQRFSNTILLEIEVSHREQKSHRFFSDEHLRTLAVSFPILRVQRL